MKKVGVGLLMVFCLLVFLWAVQKNSDFNKESAVQYSPLFESSLNSSIQKLDGKTEEEKESKVVLNADKEIMAFTGFCTIYPTTCNQATRCGGETCIAPQCQEPTYSGATCRGRTLYCCPD